MAQRSPQTFIKRQREMDKKRKADAKRQRRQERSRNPGERNPDDDIVPMVPVVDPDPRR